MLSGWLAAHIDGDEHDAAVLVLAGTALLGVLPLGVHAARRAVAAARVRRGRGVRRRVGARAREAARRSSGVSGLVAAVTAGVAGALDRRAQEVLRVWIVAGVALFVLTGAAALVGLPAQVVWGVLLVLAMLAARFVPGLAVDVPDQYLIDIERLAVTAWSARDRPHGPTRPHRRTPRRRRRRGGPRRRPP